MQFIPEMSHTVLPGASMLGGSALLLNNLSSLSGSGPVIPNLPAAGAPVLGGVVAAPPPHPVGGTPSPFVLLKNMFDPNGKMELTDPDFFDDLHEDVLEEGGKFGKVLDAKIVRSSAGHVYLRFDATESATRAAASLNGRWFAGKQVAAEFIDEEAYMQA